MLSIYRRHLKSCPHRCEGRAWRRCKCPLHVDGTLNGKPVPQHSLKTTNWNRGSEIVHTWEAQGFIEAPSKAESLSIEDAISGFLGFQEMNRGLKPKTLKNYRATLEPSRDKRKGRKRLLSFSDFCGSKGIHAVAQVKLTDLEELQRIWTGTSQVTARKYTERFKTFWEYLFRRKLVSEDFSIDLQCPRQDEPEAGEPLEIDEMIRVLTVARQKGPQDYAMVMFLRYSGLRIGDAIHRPVASLESNGKLILRQTKTGKYVSVTLPPAAIEALNACPLTSRRFWFWDVQQSAEDVYAHWFGRLKIIFRDAGVPQYHPHNLRDTFAVEMILADVDIKNVSELLGHSSVQTTERHYLKFVLRRQKKLDEQVARVWEFDTVLASLESAKVTSEVRDTTKVQ